MKKHLIIAVIAFIVCHALAAYAKQSSRYEPTWASIDSRPNPSWYDDAKFGIFIHWGVYSVPAWEKNTNYAEWYWYALTNVDKAWDAKIKKFTMKGQGFLSVEDFHNKTYGRNFKYQDFAPMFKAELFSPEKWADVFLKSGAKYVVLTSKHHEGFCLWPSKYSWNWNSVDIGPHRDLLGDLTSAVRAKGLKMGFYYSLYEWFNPIYQEDVAEYVDHHMIPQMKELVTKYQPSILWTDGEWDHPSSVWKSAEFLAWMFNEAANKDDVVINDRWGKETRSEHGGFFTSEYGGGLPPGKSLNTNHKWEENQGMGRSFGYNRNEDATNYKTSEQLVHMLIDTVSRGGNLLLDIGPTADGRIPDIMQERLLDIGDWLRVNGDAIYGTKTWRVQKEGNTVKYTSKDNSVYAISLVWPGKELVLTAPDPAPNAAVTMLGVKGSLTWTRANGKMLIEVPQLSVDELPAKFAYVFKITGVK